jgi:hypothetical protein
VVDLAGDQLGADISVLCLAIVLVGSFLLATRRLSRFEIRGGD